MDCCLFPGPRTGAVHIPASKSQAHRLLICAALGREPVTIHCKGISRDIAATADCLNALGADLRIHDSTIAVTPIRTVPRGLCHLPCGESGSTLRFLLPLVGALGARAVFHMEGRLPQRPLHPLDEVLSAHGMTLRQDGALLYCKGHLTAGEFALPGNVSSQYISGLLMALPQLQEESHLTVTGPLESAAYVTMTEEALRRGSIALEKTATGWRIPGGQRPRFPSVLAAEGDWSNAAFFLCMGALSHEGVCVQGLDMASPQGDRAIVDLLAAMGAEVTVEGDAVTVRKNLLCPVDIDAAPIPDLIPALCVTAAGAVGDTHIFNAGRLRLKESDRLRTTAALLTALGSPVEELPDSLIIHGTGHLTGGTVDAAGDHRIAMSAAVAACLCTGTVTVAGSECVSKSYPDFWVDLNILKGAAL